ncbi:MAG: bacteriochlorophyll 4-vinyl reductase [Pseudomonadota bacterium]
MDAVPSSSSGRLAPGSVTEVATALRAAGGERLARLVFAEAGLADVLEAPPVAPVEERLVLSLHRTLAESLDPVTAAHVAEEAGRRAAALALDQRVPKPAQWLVEALPPRLGTMWVLAGLHRHASTFTGSGRLETTLGRPVVLEITANPIAVAGCHWHRGVFGWLFRELVSRKAHVRETACCALGAPCCRFEIVY